MGKDGESRVQSVKKQAQERFTPPAKLNSDVRLTSPVVSGFSKPISKPPDSGLFYARPVFSTYDFSPPDDTVKTKPTNPINDDSKVKYQGLE